MLLLISSGEEESTFWLFFSLMEIKGLKGFYEERYPLLRLYLAGFDQLLKEELPDLREHF